MCVDSDRYSIGFVVEGRAKPVGSYLFSSATGKVTVLTKKETRLWQYLVRLTAKSAWPFSSPYDGPVEIEAKFFFHYPASTSKKKRRSLLYYDKIPDLDKLLRGLLDSLTGVVYRDDKQVASVKAGKFYSDCDRTEVLIHLLPAANGSAIALPGSLKNK